MKILILALLLSCDPNISPDYRIERSLEHNNKQISEIHKQILEIEKRATEIRTMVTCINTALDSSMSDRDQVLTIEECVRNARYR